MSGRLLRGVQRFYESSRMCETNELNEWFPACEGLRQGCVMSP